MWDKSSSTFEQAPVGNHAAICIKIVDIGTQENEWKGEKNYRRQNIITWELPNETREDGKPYIISKFYTASLGDKATLTKDLTTWLGKPPTRPFDPKQLLGKACQVVVTEREGSDKHVVSSVSSLTKGVSIPKKPHNPTVYLSLEPDEFDQEVFDSLSDGVKGFILKSPEYATIVGTEFDSPVDGASEADIPF